MAFNYEALLAAHQKAKKDIQQERECATGSLVPFRTAPSKTIIYLSGKVINFFHPNFGVMMTPDMWNAVPAKGIPIAIDNACFNNPKDYSDARYETYLRNLSMQRDILFATAPDVLGDHKSTVARSLPVLRKIRSLGVKAAFVAQDGWTEKSTPWDELDAIFIGGSTHFKFAQGRDAVAAGLARGKWCHMGRVNSKKRFLYSARIGCHSCDGTHLTFRPDRYLKDVIGWFKELE